MPRKRTIPRVCQQCGETFYVYPSTLRYNAAKYCSRRCSDRARKRPVAERFWECVDTSGDCWLWTGPIIDQGYGKLGRSGKSALLAHRVSWELHHGPIPDGLFVLHHCDVRACVRPEHLYLGTQAENMRDVAVRGRRRGRVLTDDEVRTIRTRYRRYSRGHHANLRELAEEYGVTIGYLWDVVHHNVYRHVE